MFTWFSISILTFDGNLCYCEIFHSLINRIFTHFSFAIGSGSPPGLPRKMAIEHTSSSSSGGSVGGHSRWDPSTSTTQSIIVVAVV